MTIENDRLRLHDLLSEQHHDLARAVWRLEQSARLVPTVDDTAWQGPARGAYEWSLRGLRRSLATAITELSVARDEMRVAVRTLQR